MGDVKISLSEKTEKLVRQISNELGIKKTEFIKYILIEKLKEIKYKKEGRK